MTIELSPVLTPEMPVLRQVWELYADDFSEFAPRNIGGDGRFESDAEFARMTEAPLELLWVRVAEAIAGFVFIRPCSHLTGDAAVSDIAQFFVLRGHRRAGVGRTAAALAFARRPGAWEVRVSTANLPGQAFWRSAVAQATGGHFGEEPGERTVVYRFANEGGRLR